MYIYVYFATNDLVGERSVMKEIHLILNDKTSLTELLVFLKKMEMISFGYEILRETVKECTGCFGRLELRFTDSKDKFEVFFMQYTVNELKEDYASVAHLFEDIQENSMVLVGKHSAEMLRFVSAWETNGGLGVVINEANGSHRIPSKAMVL